VEPETNEKKKKNKREENSLKKRRSDKGLGYSLEPHQEQDNYDPLQEASLQKS
jgi:hypothetical protein